MPARGRRFKWKSRHPLRDRTPVAVTNVANQPVCVPVPISFATRSPLQPKHAIERELTRVRGCSSRLAWRSPSKPRGRCPGVPMSQSLRDGRWLAVFLVVGICVVWPSEITAQEQQPGKVETAKLETVLKRRKPTTEEELRKQLQ